MAHRALTLKYRPQVFADMVGQDHVSTVLMRAIESGRIAHAYLFTGARGVGKTTSARILAKSLNCERRASGELKSADPCGRCTSCSEITSGVSLDVAEIDGASNRGIADVQALREKVRFSPTGGRFRVVIIDEVHQLSNDAFAALLKTLEEPPPHLVFIFATTDPQKLPETIRSRCQRYDFARVPVRKVADRLFDIQKREQADPEGVRFELTEGAAFLIARTSEGSMRDAVGALDQVVSAGEAEVGEELARRVLGIPDRDAFFQIGDAIVRRDARAALRALHAAFEKGLDARELAEGLAEHVRHLLVLRVDPEGADLVPASSEDILRLREQSAAGSEADLLRLLKLVSEVPQVMKDSPQPLVHVEAAVMQMATLEPGETLAQILERLESLERRLTGGGSTPGAPRAAGTPGTRSTPPATRESAAPIRAGAPPAAPPAPRSAAGSAAPPRTPTARPAAPPAPEASHLVSHIAAPAPAVTSAPTAVLEAPVAEALAPDERTELLWREVIGRVNQRKRMLGAFLEESRLAGSGESGIVIEADDLHCTVIEEKENLAIVHEAIREVFGHPLSFRSARPSAGPLRAAVTHQDVGPMIEQAIAFFDGEIVDPNARRPSGAAPRKERPRE